MNKVHASHTQKKTQVNIINNTLNINKYVNLGGIGIIKNRHILLLKPAKGPTHNMTIYQ